LFFKIAITQFYRTTKIKISSYLPPYFCAFFDACLIIFIAVSAFASPAAARFASSPTVFSP